MERLTRQMRLFACQESAANEPNRIKSRGEWDGGTVATVLKHSLGANENIVFSRRI
jgi:hypothetical protein